MTYRSFVNALKGYRNKAERESQERLIIMRKIMYASLIPHLKKGTREQDLMQFDFEKNAVQKVSDADLKELEKDIEAVKSFWASQDAKA